MAQLEGMGFPVIRCQKALLATGNSSAEAAMEWLFAHMDDPGWFTFLYANNLLTRSLDIDAPIQPQSGGAAGGPEPTADQIAMLSDMGFTSAQARKALRETVRPPFYCNTFSGLADAQLVRQRRARR
jgi:ubiquitin carboxyl-terminal hydrolase 5/13